MKKTYIVPRSISYELYWENGVALNILSGGNNPTLDDESDILSNKKENPIWGENKQNGIWGNMSE